MKKAISLVLLILMIFSIAIFTVSCGNDLGTPIKIEKNPPKEEDKSGEETTDPDDLKNPSVGNDDENTWNESGDAIGRPVVLPSN